MPRTGLGTQWGAKAPPSGEGATPDSAGHQPKAADAGRASKPRAPEGSIKDAPARPEAEPKPLQAAVARVSNYTGSGARIVGAAK
eukprot:8707245-Alexandrium_andersonii.AAC.1